MTLDYFRPFSTTSMRLWSLHPRYLDTKGLLAVWREGLLAKQVLEGKTKGYKNHPQLIRFKATQDPVQAINQYLSEIVIEAKSREYNFDENKIHLSSSGTCFSIPSNSGDAEIHSAGQSNIIPVTTGQILYETSHLRNKLQTRDPEKVKNLPEKPQIHPMFYEIPGDIESWEKI